MKIIQHKFVEYIPDVIEEGVLYVSIEFHIAVHKCLCGCGNEVITPISPDGWELRYNGKSVSLSPSIGNWNFDCKSHYWIKNNNIIFAPKWDNQEIQEEQEKVKRPKKKKFRKLKLFTLFKF
jgi:hypothetical protein